MQDYWVKVERLVRERTGEPVVNGSAEHAAIIMERMFAHAEQRIWILSQGLNPRVYCAAKTLEQARLFLGCSTHKLRVLLEIGSDDELKEHPFFDELGGHSNLEVRRVPIEVQSGYDYHFALMDSDSYRFERDKRMHIAVAAFGDQKGALNLAGIYDSLWNVGIPVTFPRAARNRTVEYAH